MGITGPDFLDTNSIQQIKNKTINYNLNTILNTSSLGPAANYVTTDTTQSIQGTKTLNATKLLVKDVNDVATVIPDSAIVKFPSYTIYQQDDGRVKALNGITGDITYGSNSAPATATETTALFNNVFTALAQTGGLVSLKRGTYDLNNQIFMGSASFPNARTYLVGDHPDLSILRYQGTTINAQIIVKMKAHGTVSNIGFNWNHKGQNGVGTDDSPVYGVVEFCHFYDGKGTPVVFNGGAKGEIVRYNWFGPTDGLDAHASATTDYSLVEGNYIDRRTGGNISGPDLTYGGGKRIIIRKNVIQRAPTYSGHPNDGTAISVEGWHSPGNSDIIIDDNDIEYGKIYVGGQFLTPPPTSTFDRLTIAHNNLTGGNITVDSGTNATPSNEVTNVNIINNVLRDSFFGGIMGVDIQGPMKISGNIIRDTNTLLGTGADRGGIYLKRCSNADVYRNIIHMVTTTTNASPYGIGYDGCSNCRIFKNRIINTNGNLTIKPTTFAGSNTNIEIWNNEGYKNYGEGANTFNGTGSQTAFVINHGLDITPVVVFVSTNQLIDKQVDTIGGTSFTVTFASAPSSGTNNVVIYWRAYKKVFA